VKKTSISFALARLVFLSYLTLAIITTLLVANYVVDSTNQNYENVVNREIKSISDNYKTFIEHHVILLSEQANNPIFIQTLMQPEANLGKIQDFMFDLTLLGKKYSETLLDFEGNTLHTTVDSLAVNYQLFPWINEVLSNKRLSHINVVKINNNYFWNISVAIKYNDNVEGMLTTNLPIASINQQRIVQPLDGLMIEIISKKEVVETFGSYAVGYQKEVNWPDIGVTLRFTLDEKSRNAELTGLVIQLTLLIILAIVITTLLTYIYGYRFLVKPIQALSHATYKLEQGDEHISLTEDIQIKELAELSQKFNLMSSKVAQREQALKQSYKKLTQANNELKQSESQLVQSEKMASIGLLAAGVAHEINNPIGFIKSNLEVLEDYLNDIKNYFKENQDIFTNETQKAIHARLAKKYEVVFLLEDIPPLILSSIGGVERVAEIVQSLRTFARIDQPEKSLIDVNEGLNATLNMVWNELKFCCKVHVELQSLPQIMAFPGKLNQVFMNLLINAGQAIEGTGDIYVRTSQIEGHIVVEVEDTGCGIEEKNIPQIFTPFYTSKGVGEGTGLGLSISHQIIEQHGGRIEVHSVFGEGCCFKVFLPLVDTKEKN